MIAAPERLAVDIADAQALKARAASGDKEALRSAARQFESMLVAQMLKNMRETRFDDEDDPMGGGDSLKLYRDLLDQQWAAKLSSGRGLGFADMMVKAMERNGAGSSPVNGVSPGPLAADIVRAPAAVDRGQAPLPHVELPQSVDPVRTQASGQAGDRKRAFLTSMSPHAEAAAAATGVPARFILAQAALESGWGEREIRAENGGGSHNLFGMKAGRGWDGDSTQVLTTEYRQGVAMKVTQRFRAYEDYTAAFTDYAGLLKSRYGGALSGDADSFAQGLAAGGYATDPAYAGKLKAVIASVAMAGV
jgi:flagellar protein FlgJ